jgi:hypothetical protein
MDLVDRIEKRRFVGREFLLWLWMESELFEGTLSTKEHGEFGLWIDRHITLSAGKAEVTRIKGNHPAAAREAKESLLRGKMPDGSGLSLSWHEQQATFILKAEQLAISGLKLPTALGGTEDDEEAKPKAAPAEDHEAFYERMHFTREVETILEALYRDFLALRLSPAWDDTVVPALSTWASADGEVDADAYRAARHRTPGTRKAR